MSQANTSSLLDVLQIASPCDASWDDMQGDDRVRHCGHCMKNVYNLSAMTQLESERLLRDHTANKPCVRFFRRHDGTILTQDCPVGLRAIRMRLVQLTTATLTLAAGLLLSVLSATCAGDPTTSKRPFDSLLQAIAPPPPVPMSGNACLMGDVAFPPPPPPAANQPTSK